MQFWGNNDLTDLSDAESEISETQSDIERRQFWGEGKKTKNIRKQREKNTNMKKVKMHKK